jgi:hypothetical protein
MDINVKTATDIIETIRLYLAERQTPAAIEHDLKERFGIEPITKCNGEAHSNPFIDNCMVCMPRWGWSGGRKITVRARMPKVK